jgi:hypothetical protein
VSGTVVISFPLGFYPNPNRWYRPTTPNGYTYKPIAATGTASAVSMNSTSYVNCLSACQITTTSTSTSTTSTSTSTTSTTTASPVLVKVYLEEYDLGVYAAPLLDLDLVVNTTPYYYDGNYTQYNPGNTSTKVVLKTKDGFASHQWGAYTTASVNLKVYENTTLILDETHYYRKNEGAVDFTSSINYTSGNTYIVSASNAPYPAVISYSHLMNGEGFSDPCYYGSDYTVYGDSSDFLSITRYYTDAGLTIPFNGGNLWYGDQYFSNGTSVQIDYNGYPVNYSAC